MLEWAALKVGGESANIETTQEFNIKQKIRAGGKMWRSRDVLKTRNIRTCMRFWQSLRE